MTSDIERRLEAAAEATDSVVVEWDEPGERSLQLQAPRTSRRRAVYPALSAAAVAAAVVAVVIVSRGGGGGQTPAGHGSRPPAPVPASTVPASPTLPASAQRAAARVLRRHIDGLRELSERVAGDGSFSVTAQYWSGGRHLADIELDVSHVPEAVRSNPCALDKGERPGHQGAPARDDVCTARRQPDGTTVWIQKEGHSIDRPWTTADTKEWRVSQTRRHDAYVALDVTNEIGVRADGDPVYAGIPWNIRADTLAAVVTAPELEPGDGCDPNCGVLPVPPSPAAPGASSAPAPTRSATPDPPRPSTRPARSPTRLPTPPVARLQPPSSAPAH